PRPAPPPTLFPYTTLFRSLANAAERLAEIAAAADERDLEGVLIDVELFVGGGEHLALIHEVDAERLEDLRLHEMADPCLRHHGRSEEHTSELQSPYDLVCR